MSIFRVLKISILIIIISLVLKNYSYSIDLKQKLINIPEVSKVVNLRSVFFFEDKYLVLFKQYLDHNQPERGYFKQRVIVGHKSFNAPVVFITEGYSADYALEINYVHELSEYLVANMICVEHRFFGESVPDSLKWQYLTAKNAAKDLNNIRKAFDNIYTNSWVTTGTSKGGQNAVIYKMFYPEDADITVAYVAPFAKSLRDKRHETFLNNISNRHERTIVNNFQLYLLKNKERFLPIFKDAVQNSGYSFNIPIEEVYDFCVLEYSFAFWQWAGDTYLIPETNSNDKEIVSHFLSVASPSYFANEGIEPVLPYFYQGAKELGYYGYNIDLFRDYLTTKAVKDYYKRIFLPFDFKIEFNSSLSEKLEHFLKEEAEDIIFIYGELDPWTAVAAEVGNNNNVLKVVTPRENHAVRIKSMPQELRRQIINEVKNRI